MNLHSMPLDEPFSSEGKDALREGNLGLIRSLSEETYRELRYLGLPSPWMRDISKWHPYLEEIVAVELEDRLIPDLIDKSYTLGLLNNIKYFSGDIDTILQDGYDDQNRDLTAHLPAEVVNLDYCGGLLYEGFDRISALDSLLQKQSEAIRESNKYFPYFLLFITHNSHSTKGKQAPFKEYLEYIGRNAVTGNENTEAKIKDVIEWYKSSRCPNEYRHKVFVLGKALEFSQSVGFRISIEGITSYKGDRDTPMLHYQFRVIPQQLSSPIPADSAFNLVDVLNRPVRDIDGVDLTDESRPQIHF